MAGTSPVLRTSRLLGSPIAQSDLSDFQAFHSEAAVMRWLAADGQPWSAERSARQLALHVAHWQEHGFGTWIFRDPGDGRFIGRGGLRFYPIDGRPEVEVFYGIVPDRWGNGLATEMARAIVRIGFADLALPTLVAFALEANAASRRVLAKCCFEPSGAIVHAGLRHVLYRLDKAGSDAV